MFSKYFKDPLCQLTKAPFFATQHCHATSSRSGPFHVGRACTNGLLRPWGLPLASHSTLLRSAWLPFSTLHQVQIAQCYVHGHLHSCFTVTSICCTSTGDVSDLMGDCQLLTTSTTHAPSGFYQGNVTKIQPAEFNPTLIPNHTSQRPKLLAGERLL